MQAVYAKHFPTRVVEITDYILDRADEPCGPSVPKSILAAVVFGGVKPPSRVGSDGTLNALVGELKLELAVAQPRCKRKANQLLISMIISWEISVCDITVVSTQRVRFWVKLVQVWAALRTADKAGIPAKSLSFDGSNLRGTITVSKTTGVGKTVGDLSFSVSGGAWLHSCTWLKEGWRLFEATVTDRGYLLPLPSKDLQTYSDKEPSFEQWLTGDRKMMSETCVVTKEDVDGSGLDSWTTNARRILMKGAQMFWSGHSDRSTIPTWAAAMGISSDRIDDVGRWSAKQSAQYSRVSMENARGVQDEVAKKIREAGTEDVCFETGLLDKLSELCSDRGANVEEVTEMLRRILEVKEALPALGPTALVIDSDEAVSGVATTYDFNELEPPEGWTQLSFGRRVVSTTGAGGPKTLHQVGSCWRVPGVHFRNYVLLDIGEKGDYHALCHDCFPKSKDPLETEVVSSGTDSSNSSSDSDTE